MQPGTYTLLVKDYDGGDHVQAALMFATPEIKASFEPSASESGYLLLRIGAMIALCCGWSE